MGVVLPAVVLTMSACSGEGTVVKSGKVSVLVGAEGDGNNIAGIGYGGTVTMVGTCVGINQATVIWPYGTEVVSEDPLVLDVPGLSEIGLGDEVSGGADEYENFLPDGIEAIPEGCPDSEVVAFFPDR
jgi:hypothetical protein